MQKLSLGIDTSCYTTSVACTDQWSIVFMEGTMLSVAFGDRGLRQSDGVFQHLKQLSPLIVKAIDEVGRDRIGCIAVSASPTSQEGSYMPVFLPGLKQAETLAAALGVPLIRTDHQSGHIRAALLGHEDLLERGRFFAVHISGGTTDLLLVEPHRDAPYRIEPVGRSTDLHAGQFVDRVGVALKLPFPAGKHLEALALESERRDVRLASAVRGTDCSFSGAETQAQRMIGTVPDTEIAFGVYDCLSRTLAKMFKNAVEAHGELPFLMCGGVASSMLLRALLKDRCPYEIRFGLTALSRDNAVGVALIGAERSSL